MPRKPLTVAEDKPAPVPVPARSLDEIIRERTAGLPLDQAMDAALQAIREALMAQPDDAPLILTGMERILVILGLERLLPKKEQAGIERQRLLRSIEDALVTAKWARKNIWSKRGPKGEPQPTAIEAAREVIFRNPGDLSSRFPTVDALEQFNKRERAAKKEAAKKARR
jgi:hypothetical protein